MPFAQPGINAKNVYQLAERARWQFPAPPVCKSLISDAMFTHNTNVDVFIGGETRLRARLLTWCNSKLFNWSHEYGSIRDAGLAIGPVLMPRLTLLAYIREFYAPDVIVGIYSRSRLWRHGIAVGIVASMIARVCQIKKHEDALLAGALHDFGMLAFEDLAPSKFEQLLSRIDQYTPETRIELEHFGAHHADIAGLILNHWGLPRNVVNTVRYHTRPTEALESREGELVCCVSIANYLCSRSGWTATGVHNVPPPPNSVFEKIGMDEEILRIVWERLHQTLAEIESLG